MQLVRVITSQKVEEYRIRLQEQAYLGWLIVQPVARRRRITFQEWLISLGLTEGDKKIEDLESMKKKSLEIAKRIIDMDRKKS